MYRVTAFPMLSRPNCHCCNCDLVLPKPVFAQLSRRTLTKIDTSFVNLTITTMSIHPSYHGNFDIVSSKIAHHHCLL
jgi:hypothetical protein